MTGADHAYRADPDGDPYCGHCGHEPWQKPAVCPGPHAATPVAEKHLPSWRSLITTCPACDVRCHVIADADDRNRICERGHHWSVGGQR